MPRFLVNYCRTASASAPSPPPGPVSGALFADWPPERLRKAKEEGSIIEPSEIADAIVHMLTRPRNVTIRDMVIIPSRFVL